MEAHQFNKALGIQQQQVVATRAEVAGMLHGRFADAVNNLSMELAEATEVQINQLMEVDGCNRTFVDWRVRRSFWAQIEKNREAGIKVIESERVYDGICSKENFYRRILGNPLKVAWLMTPPQLYQDVVDEACEFGLQRLRYEMLTLPMNKDNARTILEAIKILLDRSRGPVIQKIQTQNLNANINTNIPAPKTKEELDTELKELREKVNSAQKVIDVEAE